MALSKEEKLYKCLMEALKVTRHSRNVLFSITAEQLRAEGVMAEIEMERILGLREYRKLCDKTFNSKYKNPSTNG